MEVTFEIDTDGIVRVTARDKETGQEASTNINLSSGLSEADIANATQRAAATQLAPHAGPQGGDAQSA